MLHVISCFDLWVTAEAKVRNKKKRLDLLCLVCSFVGLTLTVQVFNILSNITIICAP